MSAWIRTKEMPGHSGFYYFKKEFHTKKGATLRVNICGDTRYQLFINGTRVCEGPCQGSEYVRYYDTVDLTPYLKNGSNELLVKLLHVSDEQFIAAYRHSYPALWIDGLLIENGAEAYFGTDGTWSCERVDSIRPIQGASVMVSIAPYEEILGEEQCTPLEICTMYEPNLEACCFSRCGVEEKYPLTPRPLPQMEEQAPKAFSVVRKGEGFIELDAGVYTTAKVAFRLCAQKDQTVKIIYSECYAAPDEKGRPRIKDLRDTPKNEDFSLTGPYDIIHANGSDQSFSTFWYRAFRFIRIEFEKDSQFELKACSFNPYFYPLDHDGSFTCSDDRLNEMWKISRNTVLCCMHEIYVDCPHYEQQQYDMDSVLEMLFTFRLGSDTRMPLKSLTDLAHSQLPDGMLQANYPSRMVQVIPSFTLFWVMMLREYLRYTGDLKSVRSLMGTMDKALEAFEVLRQEDGLIGTNPYWQFLDWVPGWDAGVPNGAKKEPSTVTCLMYAAALNSGAEICDALGRGARASEYRSRAENMLEAVKQHCYDEQAGLFRNTPTTREFCQHTTLWAILSGAVTGNEAYELIDRTFHSNEKVEKCTFSMNHYLFRALELSGQYRYAGELFAGWHKMMDLHCTTWCENPDNPRSECHGWSSAPIYEFSEMILGVFPAANGYESVRIQPYIENFGLSYASGTVPTPKGLIGVSWKKEADCFSLDVTLPANEKMRAEVILPNGETVLMTRTDTHFECKI